MGLRVAAPDPSPPKTKKRRTKKSRKKSKKPFTLDNLVPPSRRTG
ncbi:MAG: hypothetical protein ACE37F_23225 [Nannocystaceae bacterium]|nr:hypothetical protein [bacterium]